MSSTHSKMHGEIRQIPDVVDRLILSAEDSIKPIADELRSLEPKFITTIARGSSDHAATYLKYAIEMVAGIPVASVGPSIGSIYNRSLKLDHGASISISQSGQSPDIARLTQLSKDGGALSIAISNYLVSPLADACDHVIDMKAGEERSVAATKTFINSIVSGLLLLAYWKNDNELLEAIDRIPELSRQAIDCDWIDLSENIRIGDSLFILGRGPGLAIANEAALKFKETCQIQGEAYSSAEVLHGPVSIVNHNFPILALASRDASESSVLEVVNNISDRGGKVFVTSNKLHKGIELPHIASGHELTDPLLLIMSFYKFIENLSQLQGLNPDVPPHLMKVTKTV